MAENSDYPVVFTEAAIADLSELGRWIAERAEIETALAYVARVEAACDRLGTFPNRGTPRSDVQSGLRTVTYQRRLVIAYRVENRVVRVMRLIDTARDLRRAFDSTTR